MAALGVFDRELSGIEWFCEDIRGAFDDEWVPTTHTALTAQVGALVVTGQGATLPAHRALHAVVEDLEVDGQDATLHVGRRLVGAVAALELEGQDAAIAAHHALHGQVGQLVITGEDAELEIHEGGPAPASTPTVLPSGEDLRRMVLEALARNRAEPPPLPAIQLAPAPSAEQLAEYQRVGRALTERVRRAVRG